MALDRDVIFLVEAGEEGSSGVGIGYVVQEHYPLIRRRVLLCRRRQCDARRMHR
ncbi:MAG: hypothetical protein QM736_26875 [Vicinamibacterales bacterium]